MLTHLGITRSSSKQGINYGRASIRSLAFLPKAWLIYALGAYRLRSRKGRMRSTGEFATLAFSTVPLDRSSEGMGDAPSLPCPTASAHMTHVSQDQNVTSPHTTSDLVSKIEK